MHRPYSRLGRTARAGRFCAVGAVAAMLRRGYPPSHHHSGGGGRRPRSDNRRHLSAGSSLGSSATSQAAHRSACRRLQGPCTVQHRSHCASRAPRTFRTTRRSRATSRYRTSPSGGVRSCTGWRSPAPGRCGSSAVSSIRTNTAHPGVPPSAFTPWSAAYAPPKTTAGPGISSAPSGRK